MSVSTSDEVLAAVGELLPTLRERAQETEDLRRIPEESIKGLQATADIYQQEGILTKSIDVSKGFDKSFNASRAQVVQTAAH